jgi:2-polyprenyl-6-methoxyphenol hydroxylase-like FAD-dependent oxidoreductase
MTDRSILIVGAGPTSLTAAVELARRGMAPRIIDKDERPTPLSKAVGIAPHSLDLLEPTGVTPRLLSAGIKIRHGHVHFKGRELAVLDISRMPHRFNFLLSLPQSETERIMIDILAEQGIVVEWRTQFVGLKAARDKIEVSMLRRGEREEATFGFVYAADGAESGVRKALGIDFKGYTHRRIWSIADAEIEDWPYEPAAVQLFFYPSGDIGFIVPIGPKRFRAVSNTEDALARVPGQYRVARLLLTDTFHLPIRQAAEYQVGNVFLGGDAAHVHSPVGGRGMNLGIEDAAAFARRLSENDLAGYTDERRPIGARWIKLSERILAIAQATNPAGVVLRNMTLRLFNGVPILQRPALERFAGLKE